MATEALSNGAGSADGLTPAQKLMERHTVDDGPAHNVTIEDAVDEEDIIHPPPSGDIVGADRQAPVSEKAAGKRPEAPTSAAPASSRAPLDTQSEELFPALGAPKSRASAAPTTWSKKPAAVANGTNGLSNGHAAPSTNSPRIRTPASAPALTVPSQRGPVPQMSIPGRHTERVQFAPSQLTPRSGLKKPMQDTLRDINKRSKARVEMSTGPGGVIIFEGVGPVESVRQALKDVAKELGSKVSRLAVCN